MHYTAKTIQATELGKYGVLIAEKNGDSRIRMLLDENCNTIGNVVCDSTQTYTIETYNTHDDYWSTEKFIDFLGGSKGFGTCHTLPTKENG